MHRLKGLSLVVAFVLLQCIQVAQAHRVEGTDSVTARCERGLIRVTGASYSCANTDFIEAYTGERCDGLESCTVTAAEIDEANERPCAEPEIDISFSCIIDINCDCQDPGEYFVDIDIELKITGGSTCGTPDCPVMIATTPGRGFNIEAVDDTWVPGDPEIWPEDLTPEQLQNCSYEVFVILPGSTQSASLCGGYSETQYIFDFSDNTDRINLVWEKNHSEDFSVYIEADGCPNPEAQVGGWVSRLDDDYLAAGCFYTGQGWLTACGDNVWEPPRYQCPQYICPDGSDVEAADSDSCDSGFIPLYENNDLIGCCQENTQIAYCYDDALPTITTYMGCPSGYVSQMVGVEQKCCPTYPGRPACPEGTEPLPVEECSESDKIYSKNLDGIWARCCRPE